MMNKTTSVSRRLIVLVSVALAAVSLALAKDYQTVQFNPAHLSGMMVRFNVILPVDYATSTARYPVLYLLHGYVGNFTDWVTLTNVADYAHKYREIVVMPEGDNSFYTNSQADPTRAWEDYIIQDLIPYVDAYFRTVATRQGRAIAGLSMGGYGALKLGLKYPQMFCAVASLSGAPAAAKWKELPIRDEAFRKLMESIYGPKDSPERAADDPFELVKKVPADLRPQLYLAVGSGDFLLEENRAFVALLAQLKIPYEYRETPGIHDWWFWDRQIQIVLELEAPLLGALPETPKP